MAHQRTHSTSAGGPHSISLKVLRLSRPALADQYTLPSPADVGISPTAGLAHPAADPSNPFIISSVLQLPEAFGSAYVGETFSCTLCANNEMPATAAVASPVLSSPTAPAAKKLLSGVRISAEMQTPSNTRGMALPLVAAPDSAYDEDKGGELVGGASVQRILRYELNEEGSHVLAVTVTYTETLVRADGQASGGRVRTFRKLYQFVSQQLLNVRTKAGDFPSSLLRGGAEPRERYVLEAQLENVGMVGVSLEGVTMNSNPIFQATSLNWDAHALPSEGKHSPVLKPRDIIQVAFLLERQEQMQRPGDGVSENDEGDESGVPKLLPGDRRTILGQLWIQWRSSMGDRGSLKTAWLTNRR